MPTKTTVLLTGASGLVGSSLQPSLTQNYNLLAPARQDLDVMDPDQVSAYLSSHKPEVVIHAAASTEANRAEGERGDRQGICWRVNVAGTQNLLTAAKKIRAYFVYLSTGSVFSGTTSSPGPFKEADEPPETPQKLSWYGWTKLAGERLVAKAGGTIIRISHPVGRARSQTHPDYVRQIIKLWDQKKLYSLFIDQPFPLTYLSELSVVFELLIRHPKKGIFHVASSDQTTPYALAAYVLQRARGVRGELPNIRFADFIKSVPNKRRYTQYAGLDSRWTQKQLGINFRPWQKIIDEIFPG